MKDGDRESVPGNLRPARRVRKQLILVVAITCETSE